MKKLSREEMKNVMGGDPPGEEDGGCSGPNYCAGTCIAKAADGTNHVGSCNYNTTQQKCYCNAGY